MNLAYIWEFSIEGFLMTLKWQQLCLSSQRYTEITFQRVWYHFNLPGAIAAILVEFGTLNGKWIIVIEYENQP